MEEEEEDSDNRAEPAVAQKEHTLGWASPSPCSGFN